MVNKTTTRKKASSTVEENTKSPVREDASEEKVITQEEPKENLKETIEESKEKDENYKQIIDLGNGAYSLRVYGKIVLKGVSKDKVEQHYNKY